MESRPVGLVRYKTKYPINYKPRQGELFVIDLKEGLREEEMGGKLRTCVVISPHDIHRGHVDTIVPFSTTPPKKVEPYHVRIKSEVFIKATGDRELWAKADMVKTVSRKRLFIYRVRNRKIQQFLDEEELRQVQSAVLYSLGL